MSLIEVKLENPALKRTEIIESAEEVEIEGSEVEDEAAEEMEAETAESGGRGRGRLLLALTVLAGTAMAARRIRSWRGGEESTSIELGREEEETPSTK